VQIKCKRAGLVKIGNQYQITKDILDTWLLQDEAKQRTIEQTKQTTVKSSQRTNAKTSFNSSFLIIILSIVVLMVLILFYTNLKDEIRAYKEQISKKDTMYSNEINKLNKKLFDARDIIHNQEMEIQYLKIKDTVRIQSKW
jgi:predicted PurR-regulated permease PerM